MEEIYCLLPGKMDRLFLGVPDMVQKLFVLGFTRTCGKTLK